MIGLLSLALAAGADSAADRAAAAAGRCDRAGFEAVLAGVEDQAFAAMKAANEVVAKAARSGPIGAAGDAEWVTYKTMMAEADLLRWVNASALARCETTNIAQRDATPPSATPAQTQAAASGGRGETQPAPLAFRLSLTGGLADYQIHSPTRIPILQQTGIIEALSTSPNPPLTVAGGSLNPQSTTRVGETPRLSSKAWGDQQALSFAYAKSGWDAPGWRFFIDVDVESGTIKQYLGSPLTSNGPTFGASTAICEHFAITIGAPTTCSFYLVSAPYSLDLFLSGQAAINAYTIKQEFQQVQSRGAVERAFAAPTPLGVVSVIPGVNFGASWQSFKETRVILGENLGNPNSGLSAPFPYSSADERTGSGPSFDAAASLTLEARVRPNWPVKWSLFGQYGFDWSDINVADLNVVALNRFRPASSFGGQLEYDISPALSAVLSVQQRQTSYVSSVQPSGASGETVSDGSTVDLRTAISQLYLVGLQYRFN